MYFKLWQKSTCTQINFCQQTFLMRNCFIMFCFSKMVLNSYSLNCYYYYYKFIYKLLHKVDLHKNSLSSKKKKKKQIKRDIISSCSFFFFSILIFAFSYIFIYVDNYLNNWNIYKWNNEQRTKDKAFFKFLNKKKWRSQKRQFCFCFSSVRIIFFKRLSKTLRTKSSA